jgi:radical SAM protein with 4Fe4S-binding SPASM domain
MYFDLFKKVIDDLKEFDKPIKVLRMYKEGEPLLNRSFVEMIRYTKISKHVDYIDTTTNGLLLNPELSKKILDAGLDKINISVNGMSNKQFMELADIKVDFDKYVDNIRNLYDIRETNGYKCEICIKIAGDFLTEEEKTRFYDIFGDYTDRINIENSVNCWPNFNIEEKFKSIDKNFKISQTMGIYNQPIDGSEVIVCPYLFYSTSINSDGTISACFLDWKHKLIIGDIKKQSLKEIWNENLLYNLQIQNLNGKRKDNSICKNCGQLIFGNPDNIDKYRNKILENILHEN